MKIWGEVPKILGVYNKQKKVAETAGTQGIASKKDMVTISGKAKDYQTVLKALKDIPDIRQEKINQLSEKFSSGGYDVEGKDTADKILKSVLDMKA